MREETHCRHMGYSFRLTSRVLLYAPPHSPDYTYHGLYYTSHGALAGTRNSSMGPPHEWSIRRPIAPWANALTTELHLAPRAFNGFLDIENILLDILCAILCHLAIKIGLYNILMLWRPSWIWKVFKNNNGSIGFLIVENHLLTFLCLLVIKLYDNYNRKRRPFWPHLIQESRLKGGKQYLGHI